MVISSKASRSFSNFSPFVERLIFFWGGGSEWNDTHLSDGLHAIRIATRHRNGQRLGRQFQPPDAHHRSDAKNAEAEHPASVEHTAMVVLSQDNRNRNKPIKMRLGRKKNVE